MENKKNEVSSYFLFKYEELKTAKNRFCCTKSALKRNVIFEKARKLRTIPHGSERYSPQTEGSIYANIIPPLAKKNHFGQMPEHSFVLAAPKPEDKSNGATGMFDPMHTNKYAYGDMGGDAILFVLSDDFEWGKNNEVKNGSIEVLVFEKMKNWQFSIYQKAVQNEILEALNELRKIATKDTKEISS